jgi:WD40 repeat protein
MTGSNLVLANLKSIKMIEMVAYIPKTRELLVASTNHDLLVVKLSKDYQEISRRYFEGHDDYIFRIGISPNDEKVATGSRDQTIKVWDLESSSVLHTLKGHFGNIRGLKFSAPEVLLSCGSDGRVIRWYLDEDYHEEVTDLDADFYGIDVQDNLDKMVTVELQGNIKIWDYKTLSVIDSVNLDAGYVNEVSFWGTNDEYVIATCEDSSLVLLNINNFNYRKVSNQEGPLKWLASNRRKEFIATGSEDGTISIWEGVELEEKFHFKAHDEFAATIAFDDAGDVLFSASPEGVVRVWDINRKGVEKIAEIEEEFLGDMFDCEGLVLKDTRGLSPFRLKHLQSAGAIVELC